MATQAEQNTEEAVCYEGDFGHTFYFNDPVIAEFCPMPETERAGRLVQVRKKAGAWGSDLYFIRRNDGSLMTFENVGLRRYSVRGQYPETGFVIENPCGPPPQAQAFPVIITSS